MQYKQVVILVVISLLTLPIIFAEAYIPARGEGDWDVPLRDFLTHLNNSIFTSGNFTNYYDSITSRYANSNFTSQYDGITSRFGNENFTTRYDGVTSRFSNENFTARYDSVTSRYNTTNFTSDYDATTTRFNNENFTTRYDGVTSRFSNENFTSRYDSRTDRFGDSNLTSGSFIVTGIWSFTQPLTVTHLNIIGNITNTNVTNLSVNGSIAPTAGFSNLFDIGLPSLTWRYGYFGTNLFVGGNAVLLNTTSFSGDVSGTFNSMVISTSFQREASAAKKSNLTEWYVNIDLDHTDDFNNGNLSTYLNANNYKTQTYIDTNINNNISETNRTIQATLDTKLQNGTNINVLAGNFTQNLTVAGNLSVSTAKITTLIQSNCDVKAGLDGSVYCGTDATGNVSDGVGITFINSTNAYIIYENSTGIGKPSNISANITAFDARYQQEANAWKVTNFTVEYYGIVSRYGNANFTSQYDGITSRFGNENFTSRYDGVTSRFSNENFTARYDSVTSRYNTTNFTSDYDATTTRFNNENFTSRYDGVTSRFSNENFTSRYDAITSRWGVANDTAALASYATLTYVDTSINNNRTSIESNTNSKVNGNITVVNANVNNKQNESTSMKYGNITSTFSNITKPLLWSVLSDGFVYLNYTDSNVGIGINISSTDRLTVAGHARIDGNITLYGVLNVTPSSFNGTNDRVTDAAVVIQTGVSGTGGIYAHDGGFLRRLVGYDAANNDVIVGQTGTALIDNVLIIPGSSGQATIVGTLNVTGASNTSSIYAVGAVASTSQFLAPFGDTVSAPGFSWGGDTNLGIYRPAADTIGFTTNGAQRAKIESTGSFNVTTNISIGAGSQGIIFYNASAGVICIMGCA